MWGYACTVSPKLIPEGAVYCGHCGTQNQDDYKFCKACGADLRSTTVVNGAKSPLLDINVVEQAAPMSTMSAASAPAYAAPKTEAERLLSYLTPLIWAGSILWALFGVGQILSGLIAPEESTTVGGVINLPGGFWIVVIGILNLVGAIWGVLLVRHARAGDNSACKKLRDASRESTIFLGLQALGVVSVGGATGLICFGPLVVLEGIAWYFSQRLLTKVT